MEGLERRLAVVELQLKTHAGTSNASPSSHRHLDGGPHPAYDLSTATRATEILPCGSSSSFAQQALQAQETAQSVASGRVDVNLSELRDSFNSLRTILDPTAGLPMDAYQFPSSSDEPSTAPDLQPLPMHISTVIIKDIKGRCPQPQGELFQGSYG